MAVPVVTWYMLTGTTSSATYTSIATLDFGTVTVNTWSDAFCVRPAVATNSIQSCKWWFYDTGAQRSSSSVAIGTAGGWAHRMTVTSSYVKPSGITPSDTWGTEVPESTGSGYSYSDVSAGAYGDFCYFAAKVNSAAGEGAHTAWGYQLKYSYS